MFEYVFFDLDGTITEPFVGITESVKYSLDKFGIAAENEELKGFIGPPLKDAYMKYFDFLEKDAEKAVEYYRERYREIGIFECELYDGIKELLESLSKKARLILATSKPEIFAKRILEHFGLDKYFYLIVGASFDDSRSHKIDVLKYAIEKSGADKEKSVMIGDRVYDTESALLCGISAIGVLYGYGNREEHEKAIYIADSVEALAAYFDV